MAHNEEHGITPRGVQRPAQASLHVYDGSGRRDDDVELMAAEGDEDVATVIAELEVDMADASNRLEFERAALLRDQIETLRSGDFKKKSKPKPRGSRKYRSR